MTFADRETSRHGAEPVECYHFSAGAQTWRWTSADRVITLPIGIFVPHPISRDESEFSKEDTGETPRLKVPRDNEVAQLFVGEQPTALVRLSMYRAHRDDESLYLPWFTGQVKYAQFEESEAILECASFMATLNTDFPTVSVQAPCNRIFGSAECGVDLPSVQDAVNVTTVDGATIVSNDFALRADQWFRGGRLLKLTTGEVRFISDHVGDTITLLSPMPGLVSGDDVLAEWGCDHLEDTCRNKFANIVNHDGLARLPSRNPFSQRID
jgi:uncharacterized phage protein (TIGR02218 family)